MAATSGRISLIMRSCWVPKIQARMESSDFHFPATVFNLLKILPNHVRRESIISLGLPPILPYGYGATWLTNSGQVNSRSGLNRAVVPLAEGSAPEMESHAGDQF